MQANVDAAAGAVQTAQAIFNQRLDRAYHQAILARAVAENLSEVAATARDELNKLASSLLSDDGSPMGVLARKLGLTSEQRDFIWCVVGCSFDARVFPHVEAVGGPLMRRGLSLAVYARLAGLSRDTVVELASWVPRVRSIAAWVTCSQTRSADNEGASR